ncbi:hypothetical protein P154DRAFT_517895 [Amniculicola lignicola CBS 123094]|uniref:Sacsin/Nov domain-containing protein n=1 Tax=Amniculicola lignicola CBS 123094 TaxID=1392246 RepID=A0A6A5X1Z8_9PLEO|nr:hypothetical protein P154DRAFT_517895 [Amniculicola lignicola CBS 123094]
MAAVDFARLRKQTLADGQDSEVTVNTRALIDKVLARYSSEHTTLRELIQNASDATATKVVIRFDTDPSLNVPAPQGTDKSLLLKHIIQHHTLKRLTVSNNGQPFTAADWNRLKSIAEGNPDETKIGAFGVGFYSVFADCDEPFVVSGDKTMAFYWKGNTLSTKIASIPAEQASSDTTFSLEYRQANPVSPSYAPSKIPDLPTLAQFLATSLTFVGLQSIDLYLDDFRVVSLVKKISPPVELVVPQGLKTETEGGMMRVILVTHQQSQIDAEWSNVIATAQLAPKRAAEIVQAEVKNAGTSLKSFFSKFATSSTQSAPKISRPSTPSIQYMQEASDISGESKGVVFLQVLTVEAETRVSRSFSTEIERATKKPPPRKTRVALLTSPYHESSAIQAQGSGTTASLSSKIFSEILPTTSGRIFIGFPTAQTTGFNAHVSAPSLIPTVERENVDMNARYISTWNIELLRVAGLACRISYGSDMVSVNAQAKKSVATAIPHAAHVFKQYTATPSHPSTKLGATIEEAFWNCSKQRSIAILSSKGVMPSKSVRMPAETLSFLGEVPMVPQELATGAVAFIVNLHNRGYISELTMSDIRNGLESRALDEDELTEFLKWCGTKLEGGELDADGVRSLFEITVANIGVKPEEDSGKILPLGSIDSYVNAARINPSLPTPLETVPFAFSKAIPAKQLQMFGWTELSMVRWLRFMTNSPQLQEFTTKENIALQILSLTSKTWDQLDNASKEAVISILKPHAIMPTKMGMYRPEESYFHTVKLFEDLPTVKHFVGSKEKFLLALGVRKTIDLPMVFDRMRTEDGSKSEKVTWNHVDLIRYFATVIDEIPKKDLERLRQTAFLPGEGAQVKSNQLFKAQDLYTPDQAILSLGLTQIKLPYEFRSTSKEGVLLLRLGLRQCPDAITIINILHRAGQSIDRQLYTLAMEYFLRSHYSNGYGAQLGQIATSLLPILPTEQAPFPALVAPVQCFTNEQASCMGYAILRADLRPHGDKFGIQQNPPIKDCIQKLLQKKPASKVDAELQFGYLASRAAELDQNRSLISNLSKAEIVPIFRKYYLDPGSIGFEDRRKRQIGKSERRIHHYESPESVFVGQDETWRGILDYVHYGAEATAFLLKVGAKHEPSSYDLAMLLARGPSKFLNTVGQERYLELLRKLSEQAGNLWKDKELVKMLIASSVLLGYRDIKEPGKKQPPVEEDLDDFDELDIHREWSLNRANEVVIIDDVHYLTMFRDYIIAAPQEEQLEEFYARFGVKKISELVKADRRIGTKVRDQSVAQKLRKDILERVRLFLHEYERDASSKDIRHDAKWLSSNLVVDCVSDISIRHYLTDRNVTSAQSRTAAIARSRTTGLVLSITPKYDIYEVSSELVKHLVTRPKQNDAIALERILTESLRRLQAKGINVERILRRKEYEARIAQQQELEREYEEQQRLAEQAKAGIKEVEEEVGPATPDRTKKMPGAFDSPDNVDIADNKQALTNPNAPKNVLNDWAKKLGLRNLNPNTPNAPTDKAQITHDLAATRSNIASAIKDCRPTNMQNIKSKHHQDPPTELDKGGYCNDEQWENLHKAFTIPYSGRHIDIYFGPTESSTPKALSAPLSSFLPLIFGLTSIFAINPSAVNIFVDSASRTVAFNMSGSLFFNMGWFMGVHLPEYATLEGRQRALDSWFFTFSHELAHNLVGDHNARHSWYQSQIAVEYAQGYRRALGSFLEGVNGRVEEV